MCGCEAHHDSAAPCTCSCIEHIHKRVAQAQALADRTGFDVCPEHAKVVLYRCYTPGCDWRPPFKNRARTKLKQIRDMILVPYEEGDDAMSIPDRLRTQDANAEISYIFGRRGWVLAWGWSWFHWGLGVDVNLDSKDTPGIWISAGPLEYGFFYDKDSL